MLLLLHPRFARKPHVLFCICRWEFVCFFLFLLKILLITGKWRDENDINWVRGFDSSIPRVGLLVTVSRKWVPDMRGCVKQLDSKFRLFVSRLQCKAPLDQKT